MSKSKILLNKNQELAVKHQKGPLLVVAGAGTGKTRVITERIRNLIKNHNVEPQAILAVTFTDKASQEMLERLDDAMPLGYEEPWIYTFHSFADRILRNEGLEIGLDSSYKIISYPEQWLLLRQNIFNLGLDYFRPLGNPTKFISAILQFVSRLQDENITQEDLQTFANNFTGEVDEKGRWLELANVYRKYEELKLAESKMDFGDLITWTIKLFEERPNILRKYQQKFKHVLVDEFQDTNYAQYELIKMLCPQSSLGDRSLLAVGDDSQSIYKFRGAAVSNIIEFMEDYPSADMLTLLDNYRSNQAILDSSYSLVQNNNPDSLESKLGISKKLQSMVEGVFSDPKIVILPTLEAEVEYVIQQILGVLGAEPSYTYKDIAILARANSHLEPFLMALRKYGLPYQLVGNRGLYDRDEVRDITALLKVIINPADSISLYRVLNIDAFSISSQSISKILSETKFKKLDMWDCFQEMDTTPINNLKETLMNFQEVITEKTPVEFVYDLVHKTGYLQPFLAEESIENQLSINNLNLFLDKVKKFEVSFKNDSKEMPTVVDFLDYLELMLEAGENPAQAEIEDIDTINLMTVHASKGLEYPVVFMVNLVADRFPTRDRKDPIQIPEELIKEVLPEGNPHIQEERRLFYVGMTRAQKYLYLVGGKNYGGKRDKKPSGYLEETNLPIQFLDQVEYAKQESLFGVSSGFRDPKAQKIGDYVPYSLSFSKLEDYKTCPLKYKYKYVLNIPTPPNYALSFGITIHDTLRDYHAKKLRDENPDLEEFFEIYKKNWHPLGFMNNAHREEYFKNGKKILEDYWFKHKDSSIKPLALEKSFSMKIADIKFFGRIDRIDALPGGGVEIVDYKTGQTKDQKYVDKDNQVAFYALAAKYALGLDPQKLTYYYVESGEKFSTERTQDDLKKISQEVSEAVEAMKKGEFVATPGMHCSWCEYQEICPFAEKY